MVKVNLDLWKSLLTISLLSTIVLLLQNNYKNKYIDIVNQEINYFSEEKKLGASLALQKKLPTFGFDNILADWQFLQFIQYFGDNPAREKTGYSLTPEYFELISRYDPNFVTAYLFLSTANSIYAGKPNVTVSLLGEVLNQISPRVNDDSFYLWVYKGTDEILFTGDMEGAYDSYRQAGEWAIVSQGEEVGKGIAQRYWETAEYIKNNPDSKRAQVSAWANVLTTAFDDETRQKAIDKIRSLGGQVMISENGGIRVRLPQED